MERVAGAQAASMASEVLLCEDEILHARRQDKTRKDAVATVSNSASASRGGGCQPTHPYFASRQRGEFDPRPMADGEILAGEFGKGTLYSGAGLLMEEKGTRKLVSK
ncbi:MAG TPA: hypothetical protein VK630_03340 [Reyranella sp.]|nr:hypothetical protein [Reyranella sp.]